MARNVHDEARDVLSRLTHKQWDLVEFDVITRLSQLRHLIGLPDGGELHRHVVVSAIAALETFHRGTTIAIVNSGKDYRLRAAELIRDRKFTMKDAMSWFGEEAVTFGELVAMTLSCSSVPDLISPVEALLLVPLKKVLASTIDPFDLRNNVENPRLVVDDVDGMIASLEEAFRLRHILAHEAAPGLEIDEARCRRLLDAVVMWVQGVRALFWTTIYKDLPLTQAEMTQYSFNDLMQARTELARATRSALAGFRRDGTAAWFRRNHFAWREGIRDWRDQTYANLMGSMWPGVGAADETRAVRVRTEQVDGWHRSQYGDDPDGM